MYFPLDCCQLCDVYDSRVAVLEKEWKLLYNGIEKCSEYVDMEDFFV